MQVSFNVFFFILGIISAKPSLLSSLKGNGTRKYMLRDKRCYLSGKNTDTIDQNNAANRFL